MPASPVTANNFLLDTDYTLDKIIYMKTGSVTVPATDFADVAIPHGLSFTPLMDGNYALNSNFEASFDIGSGEPYAGSFGLFGVVTNIDADSANVNFHVINYTSSSVTVYYRLFGFMPSNVNESVAYTSSSADNFVINTDYNYTKLFSAQRLTSNTTITHNLGRRPQVSAWHEIIGTGIFKTIYSDINNPSTPTLNKITTTDVQVTVNSGAAHVRIYIDE